MLRRWMRKWLGVEELVGQCVNERVNLEAVAGIQDRQASRIFSIEERLSSCERELDVGVEVSEATANTPRRRAMLMAQLEKVELTEAEKREWEAGE